MASHRIVKVNSLIKKELAELISRELDLKPGVLITIIRVDTTADLKYTRVFVSIYPETETRYALETLRREIYPLQGMLNKKLHLKPLPRIEFRADIAARRADEIERIFSDPDY